MRATHYLDQVALRSLKREKILVQRGGREGGRLLAWRTCFMFLLVATLIVVTQVTPEPFTTFGWGSIGAILGMSASHSMKRASAYQRGWLDGRIDMAMSCKGGSSLADGILRSLDYDRIHVMGVDVDVPDSPKDL